MYNGYLLRKGIKGYEPVIMSVSSRKKKKKLIKKVLSIYINVITALPEALHCDNVERDVVKDYD